jgi:hypothetical protein
MEDYGEAFLKAFHESFKDPFQEGLPEGLREGLPKGSVNVNVKSNDTVNASGKDIKTKTKSQDSEPVPQLRRFSDLTQNLVDLWNEMVVPLGLSRVDKLTESREKAIRKAYSNFPERQDWVEILGEFQLSRWLKNETGTDGRARRDFDWLLQNAQYGGTENYLKVRNGRYRDKPQRGTMDTKLQAGIDAANSIMARRGVLPQQQPALMGDVDYAADGNANVLRATPEAWDGEGGNTERGTDGNLLRRSGGLPALSGVGSDSLGEEESESFPQHPGAQDVY